LLQLAGETDLTFVFVTHNLAQARRIGDHGLLPSTAGVVGPGAVAGFSRPPGPPDHAPLHRGAPCKTARPPGPHVMIAAQTFGFTSVAAALLLVAVALLLSWRQRLGLEKELGIACVRAFVASSWRSAT